MLHNQPFQMYCSEQHMPENALIYNFSIHENKRKGHQQNIVYPGNLTRLYEILNIDPDIIIRIFILCSDRMQANVRFNEGWPLTNIADKSSGFEVHKKLLHSGPRTIPRVREICRNLKEKVWNYSSIGNNIIVWYARSSINLSAVSPFNCVFFCWRQLPYS